LDSPIPSYPLKVDASEVEKQLRIIANSKAIFVLPHPQKHGAVVAHIGKEVNAPELINSASEKLNRYEVPSHICTLTNPKADPKELAKIVPTPKDAVASILSGGGAGDGAASNPIVTELQDIFLELLGLDYIPAPNANFFQIGGSSMTASQLASKIRKSFGVSCSGAEIFHHSTPTDLAELIHSRKGGVGSAEGAQEDSTPNNKDREFHQASFPTKRMPPQSTWFAALVQLVPMLFVFPIWQISRYLLFFATLLQKSRWFPDLTDRDFLSFLIAYVAFQVMWITIAPLVFIAIKWIVIGRYKEGRYPIWSAYYLRWWLVDVCRKLFLRGIYGSSDTTLRWYYRMLGAKIGSGARISLDCELAEFDLVTIGKDAAGTS
jgi:acyl carrier protein